MRPLVATQRVLVLLLVCPADENSSRWEKIANHVFTFAMFFTLLFAIPAYMAYFWKFKSVELETSLFAAMLSNNVSGLVFLSVVMFAFRHKISDLLNKLSDIYDSRTY